MGALPKPLPVVFIPALLCDKLLNGEAVAALGEDVEPHVLLSPKPRLQDSVLDVLSRAPAHFAFAGRPRAAAWRWK